MVIYRRPIILTSEINKYLIECSSLTMAVYLYCILHLLDSQSVT